MDRISQAAFDANVLLEINAQPSRLDLCDTNIMIASKYKVMFGISSDAHAVSDFELLRYGIGTARRGWVHKENVANTRDIDNFLKLINK